MVNLNFALGCPDSSTSLRMTTRKTGAHAGAPLRENAVNGETRYIVNGTYGLGILQRLTQKREILVMNNAPIDQNRQIPCFGFWVVIN